MEEKTLPVGAGGPPCSRAPIFQKNDVWFAFSFLVIGWLYLDLMLFRELTGWIPAEYSYAVFGVLYVAAVLGYVYAAGIRPPRESWFWLVLLAAQCIAPATGSTYFSGQARFFMGFLQWYMMHFTACYWALSAGGRLLKEGRTSNWIGFDVLNAAFVVPWGNFLRLPAVLLWRLRQALAHRQARRSSPARRRKILSVLGGVVLALVCLCFVLPLLMQADAGFAALFSRVGDWMESWSRHLSQWLFSGVSFAHIMLTMPVAMYLYGLVYGSVRGRRTSVYSKREVCAVQRGVRILPRATVGTALGILGLVYVLFILLQANHLFGAFFGRLADGFSYAEYARQGFFELCRVAAINIAILLAANLASRVPMEENRMLRLCNSAVSVLTLLLIATAASKMALYIQAYGLTVKRVLVSVFLLWMAISFVLILVRQVRRFRLVPWMVFTGAVLFCALCVLPVEDGIDAYNQARVEAGTLQPGGEEAETMLEMPTLEEVTEVAVTSDTATMATGDPQQMEVIWNILLENGRGSIAQSFNDRPAFVENLLQIDLFCSGQTVTVFAYETKNGCMLEQPYNGIYSLNSESFQQLLSFVENEGRME